MFIRVSLNTFTFNILDYIKILWFDQDEKLNVQGYDDFY